MTSTKFRLLPLLFVGSLLSSCAVLFNEPVKSIRVHTEKPSKIYYTNIFDKPDSIPTIDNLTDIPYKRSKNDLNLLIKDDSLEQFISVKSKVSGAHILTWCYAWPVAFFEREHPKSRTYPSYIYITSNKVRTQKFTERSRKGDKGSWYVQISIPEINGFMFKPVNHGTQTHIGGFGLSLGLEYYHSDSQFLSASVAMPLGLESYFPVPIDYYDVHESAMSISGSITNNHHFKNFYFGYGLSLSRNFWGLYPGMHTDADDYTVRTVNTSLGLVGNFYIRCTQNFSLGVIYRPSFYRFYGDNNFAYEHVISLDLKWRIRLN